MKNILLLMPLNIVQEHATYIIALKSIYISCMVMQSSALMTKSDYTLDKGELDDKISQGDMMSSTCHHDGL